MRLPSLICALVLVGCADSGDEGMIVLNNTAVSGDTCALTGDPGQAFLPHGYINAASPQGYVLTPLIQSRVASSIGTGSGAGSNTDPNARTILFRSADVKLTLQSAEIGQGGVFMTTTPSATINPFSVLFSGSLPPNGTANVAFEVMSATNIRQIIAAAGANASQTARVEVLAEVTIRGTLGGDEITSSPFNYPISVCTDCVVRNLGTCPVAGVSNTGNACNVFQDGNVDCCTDGSGALICPATAM